MDKDGYFERPVEELSLEEAREAVAALRKLIQMDTLLKSMLNKEAIERRITQRVEAGETFGLFLIDLDKFKDYNDTFGHRAGDDLLRLLEQLLQNNLRRIGDETLRIKLEVGRIGGDEFLLVMVTLDTSDDWPSEANQRTSNPIEQMDNIYSLLCRIEQEVLELEPRARQVHVGISIGSAMFDPNNPVSAEILIGQADEAMYEEKEEHHAGR
jgi:diguanylate cyclase (GGDEF)-like protein